MKNPIGFAFLVLIVGAGGAMASEEGSPREGSEFRPPEAARAGGELEVPLTGLRSSIRAAAGEGITFTDGDFSLTMRNRFQAGWSFIDFDSDRGVGDIQTFSIDNPRTGFHGTAFNPNLTFMLSAQWDEVLPVKDAWVNWNFMAEPDMTVGLRLGQQKTRFGRVASASVFDQEFTDRDVASGFMAATRSRGVLFHGSHGEGMLHWHAGAFNSDTASAFPEAFEEFPSIDNRLNYTFGARFEPTGDMGYEDDYLAGDLERAEDLRWSIGANGWVGNERVGGVPGGTRIEILAANIHAAMKLQGFHVLAEVYRRLDNVRSGGPKIDTAAWNLQGSYTLEADPSGHQWGFAARVAQFKLMDSGVDAVGYGFPFVGSDKGDLNEITVGANHYYHQHNMKTQMNVTWLRTDPDVGSSLDDWVFHLQFTLQI